MRRLTYPISKMRLEEPLRFYIDCPIDVYPDCELRRIEIPRELARYLDDLEDQVEGLKRDLAKERSKKGFFGRKF